MRPIANQQTGNELIAISTAAHCAVGSTFVSDHPLDCLSPSVAEAIMRRVVPTATVIEVIAVPVVS
jgi:hypothetical protein